MKYITVLALPALCLGLIQAPGASATLLYSQDFQTFVPTGQPGINDPDGWVGGMRAFGGPGTPSVEGGANDISLIAQGPNDFIATRDLGVPVTANTLYTLDLDGALYAVAADKVATLRWELGTINAGTFTPFSVPNAMTVANVVFTGTYFGTGTEITLPTYAYTTGGSVNGDNVAIRLAMLNDVPASYGGFDSIVVNAVPEPASLALIGAGLACFATRRRSRSVLDRPR